MNRRFAHIVLAILLAFAVSGYVWEKLFLDDQIVAELEIEKEKEAEEESSKGLSLEHKQHFLSSGCLPNHYTFLFQNISSGFVKHGNSFQPLALGNNPRLFLLHCQLRLHC
ncbi:MAG: hypothetical protein RIG77_09460 [Cyclobacteriaceae bacterium]